MFGTLFKVSNFNFFHFSMKVANKVLFCLSSLYTMTRKLKYLMLLFFQVLLLFFLFVMAFSTTFFLLLDDETVRRCNHYRIGLILIAVSSMFSRLH